MTLATLFSSRSFRGLVGLALVLHGLAHVAVGMAVQDTQSGVALVVATVLFLVATPGFVAAGFGAWNVRGLRENWAGLVKVSVLASLLLLVLSGAGVFRAFAAALLDVVLLGASDAITAPRGTWRTAS